MRPRGTETSRAAPFVAIEPRAINVVRQKRASAGSRRVSPFVPFTMAWYETRIGTTLPLSDFDPGLYVLRVEARSRLGSGAAASREVQIQITAPEGQPR